MTILWLLFLSSMIVIMLCLYVLYVLAEPRPRRYKCGLSAPCPPKHLAFRLVSGAANVIGPKICLEDKMWDPVLTSFFLFIFVFVSPVVSVAFSFSFFGFTLCSFFSLCAFITRPPSLSGELNASILPVSVPHFFVFVYSLGCYIGCCFSSVRQRVDVCRLMCRCKARKCSNLNLLCFCLTG